MLMKSVELTKTNIKKKRKETKIEYIRVYHNIKS